jgi:predicted nucleic acid-binding protein
MIGPGSVQIVADASVVVALLIDDGSAGRWAAAQCTGRRLVAPQLLPFEVGNALRRHERSGLISGDRADQAHRALVVTQIRYVPYRMLAEPIWNLSQQVSTYDAGYCALARGLSAPLLTLDQRLARAIGRQLDVRTPPS